MEEDRRSRSRSRDRDEQQQTFDDNVPHDDEESRKLFVGNISFDVRNIFVN